MSTTIASLDALCFLHLTSLHPASVHDALPVLGRMLGLEPPQARRLVLDGLSLAALDRRLVELHAAQTEAAAHTLGLLDAFLERWGCQYSRNLRGVADLVPSVARVGAVRLVVHDLGRGLRCVHPELGGACEAPTAGHFAAN